MAAGTVVLALLVVRVSAPERLPGPCDLAYRPGLASYVRDFGAMVSPAWVNVGGSLQTRRLELFLDKLARGDHVVVYFMGDSVTRGSGATHTCWTRRCQGDEPKLHPWLAERPVPRPGCGHHQAASDPHEPCTVRPYDPACANSSDLAGTHLHCHPRNCWRCLVTAWFERVFPGQVKTVVASKPLLFMAACFSRALENVDLLLHEQAVNAGGKMSCLQERILHTALLRPALGVVMVLWIPKAFNSRRPDTSQVRLRTLADHYGVPALVMSIAFERECAPAEHWCYDKYHGTHIQSRGIAGTLHADTHHPNDAGHGYLAGHLLSLFHSVSYRVRRRRGAPAARLD